MTIPASMALRWHQFWLLATVLGLWWWGIHQRPPPAPWQGTVIAAGSYALIALPATETLPARTAKLRHRGLRHEPGQTVAVYPAAQQPGTVDEWTGREWPWLGWLGALALAHAVALLGCTGVGRPRLRAGAALAIVVCWLSLLWTVVAIASQERVRLLLTGVPAQAVVVAQEYTTSSGRRGRPRPNSIVHFAARDATPPRDVQIGVGSYVGVEGQRIALLYLPEAPSRVLAVGERVWTGWLLPLGTSLATLLLTFGWLRAHCRTWRPAWAGRP